MANRPPRDRASRDLPLPPQPMIVIRSTGYDPNERQASRVRTAQEPSVSLLRLADGGSGSGKGFDALGRGVDEGGELGRRVQFADLAERYPSHALDLFGLGGERGGV